MLDRRTLLVTGAAALAGCGTSAPALAPDPQADAEFRALIDRLARRSRRTRAYLLRRYDVSRLGPGARVLYDAILPGAEADAALTDFPYGENALPYAVTHRNGAYRGAGGFTAEQNPRGRARVINRETARMEGDAARGVIAPDFVIDAAIPLVDAEAARAAAQPETTHRTLAEALARQAEALRTLRARATSDAGVGRLPDGEAFYTQLLHFYLGAPITPRAAYEQATQHCAELHRAAGGLLAAEGLRTGSIAERLRTLARSHYYPVGDPGRARAVADMRASLARILPLVAPAFGDIELPVAEVHALPAAQEAQGARGQRRGNSYYVDLGARRARWTLPSVVHHELIPGHIMQAQFERAASPPPLQLRYANGYSEGWATYAEQVADECGAFEDNPLGRIGYLQWMMFRMARVIADVGVHAMGWTRDQAIQRMTELQGESVAFVSIEDDVGRIAAQPGFAAAQGLAALHIVRLRDRLRADLRGRFDLPRFHRAMLRHGPLSPAGLESAVRAEFA